MYEACARTREDDAREASGLLQELFWQGTIGTRIRDAQRYLKRKLLEHYWGDNRVFELFIGKAKRIDGFELETLRAMKRARQLKEARTEYAAVTDDLARLETLLAETDAPFHGETLAVLSAIRRALAGPRTRGGDE